MESLFSGPDNVAKEYKKFSVLTLIDHDRVASPSSGSQDKAVVSRKSRKVLVDFTYLLYYRLKLL